MAHFKSELSNIGLSLLIKVYKGGFVYDITFARKLCSTKLIFGNRGRVEWFSLIWYKSWSLLENKKLKSFWEQEKWLMIFLQQWFVQTNFELVSNSSSSIGECRQICNEMGWFWRLPERKLVLRSCSPLISILHQLSDTVTVTLMLVTSRFWNWP